MKTKVITGLKKEVLVIEAKSKDIACGFIFNKYGLKELLKWELLGKPDEIKEEDVLDLIERVFINYKDYSGKNRAFGSPINSFNSALESEIYWNVNPSSFDDNEDDPEIRREMRYRWELAQEKTFDRNRTLIFVKN